MDKKQIETKSVAAVKNRLAESEYLEPYIADGDREPSYDGVVYLHPEKNKKKSGVAAVRVQVKGRYVKSFPKDKIKFSVGVEDLKNYCNNGGIIFFVVYVGLNETSEIYYQTLTPLKLSELLEDIGTQKTKTLELKIYPRKTFRQEEIFWNFYNDSHKQHSYSGVDLPSLGELVTKEIIEELDIEAVSCNVSQGIIDPLFNNEVYLYAKVKGNPIPLPLKNKIVEITVSQVVFRSVFVGGIEFYKEYRQEDRKESSSLFIGESFRIEIPKNGGDSEKTYLRLDFSPMLRRRAEDLEFMLAFIKSGGFSIGDIGDVKIDVPEDLDIIKQEEYLSWLKKAVKVLEILGYSGDIDILNLDEAGRRRLHQLIVAFIEHEPTKWVKSNSFPAAVVSVGEAQFLLHVDSTGKPNEYELSDFGNSNLNYWFKDNEGRKYPVSQYTILKPKDILTLCNIRFDRLLPSFMNISHNRFTFEITTQFLLNLLRAYDVSNDKRIDILDVAEDFALWLVDIAENSIEVIVGEINLLQTYKRKRELTSLEKRELMKLFELSDLPENMKIAVGILLDRHVEVKEHFDKLTLEDKKEFMRFPIARFFKETAS